MSKKVLVAFFVLAFFTFFLAVDLNFTNFVYADSSEGWVHKYGENGQYSAYSIVQAGDGGYAIAGISGSGALFLKTDSYGNTEWNRTYAGEAARALVGTSDGGYAFAGGTRLVKTDVYGNVEWNSTFLKASNAQSLIQTSDGGYAIGGYTGDVRYIEEQFFWLAKTDKLGHIIWSKTYETLMPANAHCVIQTIDGGYALIGSSSHNPDFLLIKTDSAGEIEWSKTYGSEDNDFGWSIVHSDDGGYVIAGMLWNRSDLKNMAALIKIDSNGNMLWMRNYPGSTPPSNVVVSDYGYILCSGLNLVKTDFEGQMLWNRSLNLTADHAVAQAHSVISTLDGGYAIVGVGSPLNSEGQPVGNGQISYAWIIKTSPEGVLDERTLEPLPTNATIVSNATNHPSPTVPEYSSIGIILIRIARYLHTYSK